MPVGMNRMDYHGGCHWTVIVIVGALILIKIWHNKEWVLRHPPSSDPSFSKTACATGALPLLTGADPFSSSFFFLESRMPVGKNMMDHIMGAVTGLFGALTLIKI